MTVKRSKSKDRTVLTETFTQRTAGVLLHVTSLPGSSGIGDMGKAAFQWIDLLVRAGQTWWQVLPLGPPGESNSPYKCYSASAGNPLLISADGLLADGLIGRGDVPRQAGTHAGQVDFARATSQKSQIVGTAWERFNGGAGGRKLRTAFEKFCEAHREWLDDFALFMALHEANGGRHWTQWPLELVRREKAALRLAQRELEDAVGRHRFAQFIFFRQWQALRDYASDRGVKLMGDMPIYVSDDSADVWANAHLFQLDKRRRPTAVAGVPPDWFSDRGQCWGNPLYDWDAMRRDGFEWWVRRLNATRNQVDLVRLDHFRGFAGYWSIPARHMDARKGRWVDAPGVELFNTLQKKLGRLPVIAEDLGVITPDVAALRDDFKLPGMRILQFAFGGDDSSYLPHNHVANAIAYTGTHDNDTTLGWWKSLTAKDRKQVISYAPDAPRDPVGELLRLTWMSVARCAVVPMQDILRLGTEARMNMPGSAENNWGWRMTEKQMKANVLDELGELTRIYRRVAKSE